MSIHGKQYGMFKNLLFILSMIMHPADPLSDDSEDEKDNFEFAL